MKAFSVERLTAEIDRLPGGSRQIVAYSGGMDSHVLLHAMVQIARARPGARLHAVHVDHGISPNARRWVEHCRKVARALLVPLEVIEVDARPAPGESPEAAARGARYRALQGAMQPGDLLLTAHHQDDQAETLLLQLLRGAGPAGLAAMPAAAAFGAGQLLRPLLAFRRSALRDYALRQRLDWIDDESNRDTGLQRNYLRHEIIPSIDARWPAAAATLARSACLQAEAMELLGELAAQDLAEAAAEDGRLSVPMLRRLSPARQRNLLRHWIAGRGLALPSQARLETVLRDVLPAADDATPCVRWSGGELRRYRDRLYLLTARPGWDPTRLRPWSPPEPLPLGELRAQLKARPARGRGLRRVPGLDLEVGYRRGGERCRPFGRRHHHSLKNLFQEAGVPPWERDRVPLVFVRGEIAAVVGYFYCEPYAAGAGEEGWLLELGPAA